MRTKWRGLRMAANFIDEMWTDSSMQLRRKDALQRLNAELGVRTVLDGCNAGHEQRYINLIENWKDPT